LRILLASLALVLVVVSLNYAVDPYGITGAPRLAHFNRHKVDINEHTRLLKKYQHRFGDYDTVILGNSRVEMGLDPEHPCFGAAGMSVYNLGIPGAGVREQLEFGFNLIYQHPVRHVFLGLDFTDFISRNRHSHDDRLPLMQLSESQLRYLPSGMPNPEYPVPLVLDYYRATFSLDSTVSTIKTVALQGEGAADRTLRGFNPARDFRESVRLDGPRALFEQKLQDLRAKYTGSWFLPRWRDRREGEFADLASFLEFADSENIRVWMFTNPFHESYWTLLDRRGLLPLYREWKSALVKLAHDHRGVIVWDFSQDSPYIHESIPPPGADEGPLRWFWEPAHYRRQLGDLMLEAMLSEQCRTAITFGSRLDGRDEHP